MIENRRGEDRLTVTMFVAGCLFVAAAVVLAAFTTASDKVVLAVAVIGALCMPTHRFIQALKFWGKSERAE